jgi:hypothetical protein
MILLSKLGAGSGHLRQEKYENHPSCSKKILAGRRSAAAALFSAINPKETGAKWRGTAK